ncbi:MAG: DNA repair protein RadC [Alphaproteobacteria bacterium]|nr:DNA repair protein RadC [Alphaproteobacteria bacterium]
MHQLPSAMRPREKLLALGPQSLSNAELLAIVLRTGLPGLGVLHMAQSLLDHFGGLSGLLGAQPTQLRVIKGLGGTAKRAELGAVLELARRAMGEQLQVREAMGQPSLVQDFVQLHLGQLSHEVFGVLFLDAQHRLIRFDEMFRGTLTQTSVYPREVVQQALQCGACAVVLAHNHPSGQVQPSRADQILTQTLREALALVDVRVLDHVIVGPGQSLSMAQKGWI